jgi:hypothetical protein
MTTINLNDRVLQNLDLSPIIEPIESWLATKPQQFDLDLQFAIDFPREPLDPRELSEIPEIRLWFIRADARYPFLPLVLDWQAGELSRYIAMLVPHQFHRERGIQYNPEALEIWVMQRIFISTQWLQQHQIIDRTRLKFMTQMVGYELDDGLFALLES